MKEEIGISFGILADKISVQLQTQGLSYKEAKITEIENDLSALHRLMMRDVIPDTAYRKAIGKLFTQVKRAVK